MKPRTLAFYDRQHMQRILMQQNAVGAAFNRFITTVSPYLRKWADRGGGSVWVRNSTVENAVDSALTDLQSALYKNIADFQLDAWKGANLKNDDMVSRFIEGLSVSGLVNGEMFRQNMDAFKGFLKEVDANGLELSQKVWKITDQAKTNLEFYLSSGIATGRSAAGISGDIRQVLQNPGKRFRRVRDENGRLQLSRPMQDYHPGAGVYRSSRMNALRLAATQTNRAYRKADYERWQQLDFILGIEVQRSPSNRGPCPLCDSMAGMYPKGFQFLGWHPFCICIATPLLLEPDEFADFLLDDEMPKERLITDIPTGARSFVSENESMKKSHAYRDNKVWFSDENQKSRESIRTLINEAEKPAEKKVYASFDPFSPAIFERLDKTRTLRERRNLFNEIISDPVFEVVDLKIDTPGKTYRHPLHRGKGLSPDWLNTLSMAKDINRMGDSVYFLPEYPDKVSADAIVRFGKEWKVADFKYSESTNWNTLQENLTKGFIQGRNVVIKLTKADSGQFREAVEYMRRNKVPFGNIKLINRNGKIIDLSTKELVNGGYVKIIKGSL